MILAAYSDSFRGELVLDNAVMIHDDPRIRAATSENLGRILTEGYWHNSAASGLYRPVTTLSYLVNYAVLGEGRPAGYHWVNLALHGINVVLVYALGLLIFAETGPAWALAAIWGLHPVLTESVTNIVGRADLLSGMGVLAGFWFYVKSTCVTGRRRVGYLMAMVGAQTVGLFSKESAAVLPGIILLYDVTWSRRTHWRDRAPAYASLAIPFLIFFYLRSGVHGSMGIGFADNPLVGAGFWQARFTAIGVIGKLLGLIFWPAHLSADYSYNSIPVFGTARLWNDAKTWFAMAVCAGAVVVAVTSRHSRKPLTFWIGLFFLTLLPTSNLIFPIGSIMAERFLYVPSIGVIGFAIGAMLLFGRRFARFAWVAVGLVCMACAARTYARNLDWKDGLTLWTSAVNSVPDSWKAHNNLGTVLLPMPGRLPDAVGEFETALRIYPDCAPAHYNLGSAFSRMPGRLTDAIAQYQSALRIYPDYAEAHGGLGEAFSRAGQLGEANVEYQAALRIRPDFPEVHNNLGILLAKTPGRLSDAISEYQAALASRPDFAEAHINLGFALAQVPGRLNQAIDQYQSALRIDNGIAEAHFDLGNALMSVPGRLTDAIAEFKEAVRINPDYAEAHNNLGIIWPTPGQLPDAVVEFRQVARLKPDDPEAHKNLGRALLDTPGGLPEAIAEFETALRIKPDPAGRQMLDQLRGSAPNFAFCNPRG